MNSVSESFKSNPTTHLKHIVPIDFKTAINLPDSHTWNHPDDQPPVHSLTTQETLPVIDIANPQARTLIQQACEKWGAFQVTNHGIPIELLNEIEFQTKRLFSLPADQKHKVLRSPEDFTGYGLPRISNFFPKLMWAEGFTIMGSPIDHARKLWPHDHINFCNAMVEYQKELKELTERLLGLMFTSLGLEQEDNEWFKPKKARENPQAVLQLNSYPVCPDPNLAMGMAPHTDTSLLTLVYQGNISGLQVFKENVGWLPVHPIPGAFTVTIGDLMHIFCNGRFKSALHRALVNKTYHRISTAFFYGPPRDVKISPPLKLIDHAHPILYRPVTYKEYLDVKATHFDKSLEFIRHGN